MANGGRLICAELMVYAALMVYDGHMVYAVLMVYDGQMEYDVCFVYQVNWT